MNKKQFINELKYYDEAFLNAPYKKEVLTTFLKRMLRHNERQELNIKKSSDIKSSTGRQVSFIEKRTGTAFKIEVTKDDIFLIY